MLYYYAFKNITTITSTQQFTEQPELTIGEALGAVAQSVTDDDEGGLVGFVGRADREGAIAGPFDGGSRHAVGVSVSNGDWRRRRKEGDEDGESEAE